MDRVVTDGLVPLLLNWVRKFHGLDHEIGATYWLLKKNVIQKIGAAYWLVKNFVIRIFFFPPIIGYKFFDTLFGRSRTGQGWFWIGVKQLRVGFVDFFDGLLDSFLGLHFIFYFDNGPSNLHCIVMS